MPSREKPNNFWLARNPSSVDATRGDHFLQADLDEAARNFRVPDSLDHVLVLLVDTRRKKNYFAACGFVTL